MAAITERNEEIKLEVLDFEIACAIMGDIQNRETWSTPHVLAQWVATIRTYGRPKEKFGKQFRTETRTLTHP